MKNAWILISSLFLLSACTTPDNNALSQGDQISGFAGPLVLSASEKTFHLHDFILDTMGMQSIVFEPPVSVESNEKSTHYHLSDTSKQGFTVAKVSFKKEHYEIPVFFAPETTVDFFFEGAADSVFIFGTFNAWNRTSSKMEPGEDNLFTIDLSLKPDRYQYKYYVWRNGSAIEKTDPLQDSISNGSGGFNSTLVLEFSGETPVRLEPVASNIQTIKLNTLPSDQKVLAFWQNQQLPVSEAEGILTIQIPEINPRSNYAQGRSHIRIYSIRNGRQSNDLLIPLENGSIVQDPSQLTRSDWQKATLYFMMVDRFRNGNKENDAPLDDPNVLPEANFYGGDIAGIHDALKGNFFNELGTNTLWLSPISENPKDAWGLWNKGGVVTKFSGYHGYWPVSNIKPDARFGTPDEIKSLLNDAHADNQNVLLDYVANHVHEKHPVYIDHPDWATPLYLPDGTLNTERWDDQRLTTWFDTFMPTLDLRRKEVVEPMTDSALVWVTEYDFDGFRHDATKHIDELYWRTLTRKIKKLNLDRKIYQIGETYGSPELIASYIGNGLLDAQFDFNTYDAAVMAFSSSDNGLENLKNTIEQSIRIYGGHNLMGYISGNQDRSRFISIASGDVLLSEDQKLAGWTREITKPKPEAYQRLALLHAFNFAIPGIPVIYYGDEYGNWGANDPDNRKMMKFNGYTVNENKLRLEVQQLLSAREGQMALTYGETEIHLEDENLMKIERTYLGDRLVIWINAGTETHSLDFENAEVLAGTIEIDESGKASIAPLSFVYLKP